jgi:translocator protein
MNVQSTSTNTSQKHIHEEPNHILRQVAVGIAVVVTLVCNWLSSALPLNNRTAGAISDSFHVYFVPAGYVFSIWGVIYLGLLAFTVYQFLPQHRTSSVLQAITPWFLLSCAANSGWIFLWHYGYYGLTMAVMLVLLFSLIKVYILLDIGNVGYVGAQLWCVRLPFSIYLGWICVATIANATTLLDYVQWNGFGISPEIWTVVLLAVGVALAAIITETRHDAVLVAVLLWAFVGIAIKHTAVPIVGQSAWTACALTAFLVLRGALYSRRLVVVEG